MNDLLNALGHAVAYAGIAGLLLVISYFVLDLVTPGRLGSHLLGADDKGEPSVHLHSFSASVVTAAWLVSNAAVLFTSIWTNGATSLGTALGWTVAFGVLGILLNAVMLFVIDAITPGNLRDVVCRPGPARPLAYVAAATSFAVAAIVCASIA
jgi:hypothetical protein